MSTAAADPEAQAAFEAEAPSLAALAPHLYDAPKRDIIQSRVLDAALRDYHDDPNYKWRPQYQRRGTCVGQCYKLGFDQLLANAWLRGLVKFPGRVCVAAMYAGGRFDVSGQPGTWDGSFNHATSKWATTRGGVLLLKALGLADDDRNGDEAIAVKWTASREGVPADMETLAAAIKGVRSVRLRNFDDCAAVIEGRGVVHWAASLIPPGSTDRHGFAQLRSAGGHSVCGRNLRRDPDGISYDNSWGPWAAQAVKYVPDQPEGSVWLDRDNVNEMCRRGDVWGSVDVTGLDPGAPLMGDLLEQLR